MLFLFLCLQTQKEKKEKLLLKSNEGKKKSIEQLREERLLREKQERRRAELLLNPNSFQESKPQTNTYNSGFHSEIVQELQREKAKRYKHLKS